MYSTKDVTRTKDGKYILDGTTFIEDQYGGVYMQMEKLNFRIGTKKGRTTRQAIVDEMNHIINLEALA
jgi:hypothetical protein